MSSKITMVALKVRFQEKLEYGEMIKHVAKCPGPERTVECPIQKCKENVQLNKYYEHCVRNCGKETEVITKTSLR